LEVGYVGNQGRFLETMSNANMPPTLAGRIAYAESGFGGNTNTRLTPFGASTTPAGGNTGGWGAITLGQFNGVSHYDSLQALFKTRVKVVDAQFAYTYSHSLSSTDISDSSGTAQAPNVLLANDPKSNYGNSILNRPQILAGSLVYNAPALTGQNSFVRAALGSWETSAIMQYTSGASLTVYSNAGNDIIGSPLQTAGQRPNLVSGQSCDPGLGENHFINPNKFTLNGYRIGALPTSPRGVCLGPGLAQTDFSIRKNFKITERVTAKFSMDFFNLFNKTQFLPSSVQGTFAGSGLSNGGGLSLCNQTFGTAQGGSLTNVCPGLPADSVSWTSGFVSQGGRTPDNFGQATADRAPRQIQYGLKIEF